jgi:hypothetical protein
MAAHASIATMTQHWDDRIANMCRERESFGGSVRGSETVATSLDRDDTNCYNMNADPPFPSFCSVSSEDD